MTAAGPRPATQPRRRPALNAARAPGDRRGGARALSGCSRVAAGSPARSRGASARRAALRRRSPAPAPALRASAAAARAVPDAMPRFEPRSLYGNPPFYDVFGKRYYVMASSADYVERGVASWYGPGFHKERTSIGEPYDMYGMTAAHKTLPLPAYVRVTNLQNGRSMRGARQRSRPLRRQSHHRSVLHRGRASSTCCATAPPWSKCAPLSRRPTLRGRCRIPATRLGALGAAARRPSPRHRRCRDAAPARRVTLRAGAHCSCRRAPSPIPPTRSAWRANCAAAAMAQVFVRDDLIAGRRMYRVRIGPVPDVPGIRPHRRRSGAGGRARCASRAGLIAAAATGAAVKHRYTQPLFIEGIRPSCSVPWSRLLLVAYSLPSRSLPRRPFRPPPTVDARAYTLVDYHTGKVLAAQDPDARMEPASLTKLMTAYIVFEQLAAGKLKLDEPVVVSEHAWRSEGLAHLHRARQAGVGARC